MNLVHKYLVYLRQEAELKSKDKKSIKQEQRQLAQLRKQTVRLVKQLENERDSITRETKKIIRETKKIEKAKGERAAVSFGKHFESQALEYKKDAKTWLAERNSLFAKLYFVIKANLTAYGFFFLTDLLGWWPHLEPIDVFTLQYGLVNFALLSLLSYGVSFASRNYNVSSNLQTVNLHRKNVAETFKDFYGSGLKDEDRSKILEEGVSSMFKHLPIGYLSKAESRDDGPVPSFLKLINR